MKRLILILIAIALLPACDREPKRYQRPYCETAEEKEELKDFVLKCIKDANPQSDEEPEDWIRQCQDTGEDVVCPVRCVYYSGHQKQLCDSK